MAGPERLLVPVADAVLEVLVLGEGEPVLLIQTAQVADELLPVARLLADEFSAILPHRRGYAGSSLAAGPGSVRRDAADCAELLGVMGVERAHVVGLSYSGAVAMEMAARWPGLVSTLCLVEPPPLHVPSAPEFRAANVELLDRYFRAGAGAATEWFGTRLLGPGWRADVDAHLPGSVAGIERDADTFFATDLPALLAWEFGPDDAARVRQPVLHVGGTESGPWFAEVRALMTEWFPQAEDVVLPGADHSLALTHAPQVADALRGFLRRHPAGG